MDKCKKLSEFKEDKLKESHRRYINKITENPSKGKKIDFVNNTCITGINFITFDFG